MNVRTRESRSSATHRCLRGTVAAAVLSTLCLVGAVARASDAEVTTAAAKVERVELTRPAPSAPSAPSAAPATSPSVAPKAASDPRTIKVAGDHLEVWQSGPGGEALVARRHIGSADAVAGSTDGRLAAVAHGKRLRLLGTTDLTHHAVIELPEPLVQITFVARDGKLLLESTSGRRTLIHLAALTR